MLSYIAVRLSSAVLTLLVVSVLIFGAIHMAPGSFADIVLGAEASQADKAAFNHRLGIDRPLPEVYVSWITNFARGDFGISLASQTPISNAVAQRLPVTAELAAMSMVISLLMGIPLGVIAGVSGSSLSGTWSRIVGAAGVSVPAFVTGAVLIYIFSRFQLGLSVGGFVPFFDDPLANLAAMVLPALTLSPFTTSLVVRVTRDAVREVLTQPYITNAVARGETTRSIVQHHVLRNSAIPIVTIVAVSTGALLGGAVVVEQLFTLPGIGQYILAAVKLRDYAVVESTIMLAAAVFITVNMLADIAYAMIDPRIGTQSAARR